MDPSEGTPGQLFTESTRSRDQAACVIEVRNGASDVTGKIVVIGSKVNKDAIRELFGL